MDSMTNISAALEETDGSGTAINSLSDCPLMSLPPEIRNNIYELAFTACQDAPAVELFKGFTPGHALLATCSRIHQEAHGIWKTAFWRYTPFYIDKDVLYHYGKHLKAMNETHLRLVTRLDIREENPLPSSFFFEEGLWFYYSDRDNGAVFHILQAFYPADAWEMLLAEIVSVADYVQNGKASLHQWRAEFCKIFIHMKLEAGESSEDVQGVLRALKCATGYDGLTKQEFDARLRGYDDDETVYEEGE